MLLPTRYFVSSGGAEYLSRGDHSMFQTCRSYGAGPCIESYCYKHHAPTELKNELNRHNLTVNGVGCGSAALCLCGEYWPHKTHRRGAEYAEAAQRSEIKILLVDADSLARGRFSTRMRRLWRKLLAYARKLTVCVTKSSRSLK